MAKYLDWQRIPDLFARVELGVTGDVVKVDGGCPELSARYERVVTKGFEEYELWLETHVDAEGQLTGDWDAVFAKDARELGLWKG